MFPDFIPIEFRGMSILTAITFFFYTVVFTFWYSIIKKEFKRICIELYKHEEKLIAGHDSLAGMKTDIALLLQSVTRIEKMIGQNRRDEK